MQSTQSAGEEVKKSIALADGNESATSANGRFRKTNVNPLVRSYSEKESEIHLPVSGTKEKKRPVSQSLIDLVTCPICLEQLRRPTMLPCQHTFCMLCLQNMQKNVHNRIVCPTCRQEITIPEEGVSGFPLNMSLMAFLDVIKNNRESFQSDPNGDPILCSRCLLKKNNKSPCHHCNKVFCNDCQSVHNEELKLKKIDLTEQLKEEEHRLSLLTEEYQERYEKLMQNILVTAEIRMQKLLDDQDRLIAELSTWKKNEDKKVVELRQKCIEIMAVIRRIQSSAEKDSTVKEGVVERGVKILEEARKYGSFQLTFDEEEFSLTCATDEDLEAAAIEPDPVPQENVTKRTDEGLKRRVTFAGKRSTPMSSTAESKKNDTPATDDDQSFFYRCKSADPRIRVTSSLLQRPAGIAVSPWTGDFYVAATDSHLVYVMDRSGKIVKSLGSPYRSNANEGSSNVKESCNMKGTFLCPSGIAFSVAAQEIYVTDKWLNCIQIFSKDGNYLRKIGAKGTSPGHFRSPEGIAVDHKGYIYVCDTCNDRVQVLDKMGSFVRELGGIAQMRVSGGKILQKREFNEPTGVAITPDGSRIAVTDCGNCRVKIFNSSGQAVCVFGFRGTQRGQFKKPECIAIDSKGFLIVGDNGNGRIQIFRPNGNLVRVLGNKGVGPGEFNWISGIALTNELDIVVSDFKNHCIQVF